MPHLYSVNRLTQSATFIVVLAFIFLQIGCDRARTTEPAHSIVPNPSSITINDGEPFNFDAATLISFDTDDEQGEMVATFLADLIGNTVDTTPAVQEFSPGMGGSVVRFTRQGASASLGDEGYTLVATPSLVTITAREAAGLFYGVQTIRQMLPALVEYTAAYVKPLPIPAVTIEDQPRFAWRGAMLDVARHFLPAQDVKRFIDLMALYKMNRLHLHLSDDQGWRIEIPGRPRLTEIGSQLQVGGKSGGFYTTSEYKDIVAYAAARFITIVPEIDLPGHTTAALASYAELNCDGIARALYTGTNVGFSSVCPDKEETYQFIDDIVREISAMSPGPYFHMGGDEVETLSEDEYINFVERVQTIVESHGKRLAGWDEILAGELTSGSIAQLWRPLWPESEELANLDSSRVAAINTMKSHVERAVSGGVQFVISPANRVYLDMKYNDATILGLTWAGVVDEQHAYDWDIADVFSMIPESNIAGVEAPIWSESLGSIHDIEFMAFPRMPGVAELGWSASDKRDWSDYRLRIARHAQRWTALGVNYRRSAGIPWSPIEL